MPLGKERRQRSGTVSDVTCVCYNSHCGGRGSSGCYRRDVRRLAYVLVVVLTKRCAM